MTTKDGWTPYGLEAIRIARIRRRRLVGLALVLGLGLLYTQAYDVTTVRSLEVSAQGGGGNQATIEFPEQEERKPLTIALSPGRVTRATTGDEGPTSTITRSQVPSYAQASPIPWGFYATLYGPYALLGLALYFLTSRTGKRHEINYGIYKGSMPYEMITAMAARQVRTTRWARGSVFGRRRADYLPAGLVERMPAEEEP